MDHVEVAGLRIAYERAGTGPALVLLHGGFQHSGAWWRQLEGLSGDFTVVAWDAPGCGGSAVPPRGFGVEDYGDCLAGFIDALGLGQPHVLGLSLGSVIALELYRGHPGVPASLILASAYAGWAGSLSPAEVARRTAQVLHEIDLPPAEFVPGWIPTLLTEAASADLVSEVSAVMSEHHPAGTRVIFEAFAPADYRSVLPTIAVPTLLLYGELDRRSPVSVAQGLHEQIPGSTLIVMPAVGHVSNIETPDRFNAEVRRFLLTLG